MCQKSLISASIIVLTVLSHLIAEKKAFASGDWTLNDVSVLIPLPENLSMDPLLKPTSVGSKGVLLPWSEFSILPPVVSGHSSESLYSRLRVVGIRIDPCFPGSTSDGSRCQPQIRMVWQILEFDVASGEVTTLDASLHTFYDLTHDQFDVFVDQLKKTLPLERPADEPLGVHPVFAKDGLNGPRFDHFKRLILHFAGASTLSKVTYMRLVAQGNGWTFGGITTVGGRSQMIAIPRIGTRAQGFLNNSVAPTYFENVDFRPKPKGSDTLDFLITDSLAIDPVRDEKEILESVKAAVRIENPEIHSPLTIDCVSCHTSQMARLWAFRSFPALDLEGRTSESAFRSAFNLDNLSPSQGNTKNLRAFGYFGRDVAISQRTLNESASAADRMNNR